MSLELPKELEAFVEERIGGGGYANVGDVLRTAFGLLQERERLLEKIDAGTAQFSSGQFTEYDDDSFERFFADIEAEAQRLRAKKNGA